MKRLLYGLLACASLVGCNEEAKTSSKSKLITEKPNDSILKEQLELIG